MGSSTQRNAVGGDVDNVYGQVAVAMDSQGNGGVLWVQSANPLPYVVHAAMWSAAHGWQAPSVITQNATDSSYGPQLAFDGSGNAIAVWQQQTGIGAFGGTARYVAGSGWGSSGSFASTPLGDVYDPHLAVDAAGKATVVWYEWPSTGSAVNVYSTHYTAGGSWAAEQLVSATSTVMGLSVPVPRVASNAAGQVAIVWGVDEQ